MDKDEKVLKEWSDQDKKIDDSTAKKIVRKTRLSLIFTVVRTVLGIFLIYALYMMAVSMYFHFSGNEKAFERFAITTVDTRYHGMSVHHSPFQETEISPLLTKKTNLTLYRKIGAWDVIVGSVEAKKSLFGELQLNFTMDSKYLNVMTDDNYATPPDLLGREAADVEQDPYILDQLNKISDGYVTQLQFSLKESMSPKDLLELLDNYDVATLEIPVYAGELSEDMNDMGYVTAGNYVFTSNLKLRPFIEYDDENRFSAYYGHLDTEVLEESIDAFEKNLAWLIDYGGYSDEEIDEKRLNYLKENDYAAIGVVVTGPIREIEKLIQENENIIHRPQLDGFEVWNWY